MKKQPMPANHTDAAETERSEEDPLVQSLEKMLFEEGLLHNEPKLQRCLLCRKLSTDCDYHEGLDLEGNLCPECAPIVDRVESFLGERGTGLERHLRAGQQHFLFVKPGRRPGAILMVTADAMVEWPYFDATDRTEEYLIRKLGLYITFS